MGRGFQRWLEIRCGFGDWLGSWSGFELAGGAGVVVPSMSVGVGDSGDNGFLSGEGKKRCGEDKAKGATEELEDVVSWAEEDAEDTDDEGNRKMSQV